ncbi:apoptosis-stimulating of p53 protein 1-like isoform X3 [Sphaeramia orbicularis]|uniref:apoptosis-stimulating of p53 protein 1-like isoform X3 n=1 Tax=Sphaeramia orbicularis TaxID=375764 RepID=UPI001180B26F|nr:apoptosis-stimulating of p53 protein 1-like isoform X3 [Sphaeramia orbicularis]
MKRFFGLVLERLVFLSKSLKLNKCRKPRKKVRTGKTTPRVILTVYLNDTQQMLTEVPVTPATRVVDVVEYCKEAGEGECHLAEVWNGHERVLPQELLLLDLLQQWGARRPEVRFYLRHCPPWTQGSEQPLEQSWTTEATESANDRVPRVELTLSELQEMATRQQQQIEAQQQMLVAKEQRLRYLQQGGRSNQGQTQSEAEKLQRLKERVETQEAKLKKIRAMRGQVDYSKLINGNLSAEIDHVSGLFQEKQAELQTAVIRVDQLTQQLEDLRRGRLQLHSLAPQQGAPTGSQGAHIGSHVPKGSPLSGPAALELRKLYQELQARNRHNLEQSSKLAQNKELLNKRNAQVTVMDQRIGDLRERLHKKRAELSRLNGGGLPSPPTSAHSGGGVSGRVAAVCPYIQVPADGRQDAGYPLPPDPPPKPTPLSHIRSLSEEERSGIRKSPGQWKVSDLDIVLSEPTEKWEGPRSPQGGDSNNTNEASWPSISKSVSDWRTNSPEQQLPSGYGTYPSATHQAAGHHCVTSSLPRSAPGTLGWPRSSAASATSSSSSSSSSQQIQQRISVPPTSNQGSATTTQHAPLSPQIERTDPPPAVAVRPYVPDHPSRPQSPRKGPATMNSSSIYSMYLQQPQAKNYGSLSNRTTVKAVYGKPILPTSSSSPSPVPFLQGGGVKGGGAGGEDVTDKEGGKVGGESSDGQNIPPPSVDNIPRPLSPTKLTPVAHSQLRYQSDADLEVLRRRLSNAPRPLKKRSSITEPEGPQGPNIQKLLYQRFNTLAGGMEGGSGNTFYQPECLLGDVDNIHSANGNIEPNEKHVNLASEEGEGQNSDSRRLSPPSVAIETPNETMGEVINKVSPVTKPNSSPPPDRPEDQNNNNQKSSSPAPQNSVGHTSPSPTPPAPPSKPKVKRTNLKKPSSERTGHGLRVKFNPLALLLDASLEGEFDLVQRIIYEVENPSMPNDEGITPLHNAVCAGHHHIVKFLLDFGVNVNAADSDGWTPLHCAASCNSVHLCKMLVESGAAIFASTISDVETAADKCEEMEEGYTQCSQFLYGVQEKLGVMNKGLVYALWNYTAQQSDELSFSEGDAITVLRRRDDTETEWWWARLNDREGYIPRNLLGLYPRIKPRQRSLA